ncbi:MAG: PTS sugar transporter subunit IIA [Bacillota bacterium]
MDGESWRDVLQGMAGELECRGVVSKEYVSALLQREEQFPTGLPTEPVGVAIPHADAQFVRSPAIAVAKLRRPVLFRRMDLPSTEVAVSLVVMLAIHQAEWQVRLLEAVARVLQDPGLIGELASATSGDELRQVFLASLRGCEAGDESAGPSRKTGGLCCEADV